MSSFQRYLQLDYLLVTVGNASSLSGGLSSSTVLVSINLKAQVSLLEVARISKLPCSGPSKNRKSKFMKIKCVISSVRRTDRESNSLCAEHKRRLRNIDNGPLNWLHSNHVYLNLREAEDLGSV